MECGHRSRPRPGRDLRLVRGTAELNRPPAKPDQLPIAGIVPAAGFGTRLGAAGSKEVQPVGGRPVIDHLIERMRLGGATRIRIVTRPEKTDVIARCEQLEVEIVLDDPGSMALSLAAGVRGLAADQIVLLGFPDSIWAPPEGFRELVEQVRGGFEVALGLFGHADVEVPHVVDLDRVTGTVRSLEVRREAGAAELTWECAAARVRALGRLAENLHPTGVFAALAASGAVGGAHLSDECADVGTPGGMQRALERYG